MSKLENPIYGALDGRRIDAEAQGEAVKRVATKKLASVTLNVVTIDVWHAFVHAVWANEQSGDIFVAHAEQSQRLRSANTGGAEE